MLFELFISVLLAAHLLCVNVSSVGPLMCVWAQWRGRRDTAGGWRILSARLAVWCVALLFLGMLLGLSAGILCHFQGDTRLTEALPNFERKIWWGVGELVCYVAWMGGYWVWLRFAPPRSWWQRGLHHLLAVFAATNLLYHFPPLLTVMAKSAVGEVSVSGLVDADEFRRLSFATDVLAHTLHFTMASAAVCGTLLMWMSKGLKMSEVRIAGARLALCATVCQIPVGVWLLSALSPVTQSRALGSDALGTTLFVLSMLATFYLMQNLATAAFSSEADKEARRAVVLMLVTVTLMTGTLRRTRFGGPIAMGEPARIEVPIRAAVESLEKRGGDDSAVPGAGDTLVCGEWSPHTSRLL